ncbi:outer membrane beta-barrel protein [Oxalobacteraceae bacterium A2-2]
MNKFLCSILIAAAAMPLAHAEDVYVGASINQGARGHVRYSDAGVVHDIDAGGRKFSGSVFAGYVLSPSWALETGYRGQAGDSVFDLEPGYQLKTSTSLAYLAARNTWQLSESWALYGKLGVAQGRFKAALSGQGASLGDTVHKTGAYVGLGAAFTVGKDVALQLELEHTDRLKQQGLNASMDKISLGLKAGF